MKTGNGSVYRDIVIVLICLVGAGACVFLALRAGPPRRIPRQERQMARPALERAPLNPVLSRGLRYDPAAHKWFLSAKALQVSDRSIWGRPGRIVKLLYVDYDAKFRVAWAALDVDGYELTTESVTVGQIVTLYVEGTYVSEKGVDWSACPISDEYCVYANFVEGGYPASEDYDGLTMCPSNDLIRSGHAPLQWFHGILFWKIETSDFATQRREARPVI
jgi:hypothetical protein